MAEEEKVEDGATRTGTNVASNCIFKCLLIFIHDIKYLFLF